MCGIAGFFHFEKEREANKGVLVGMTDCISHRGPDGDGYYVKGPVALGHRRLSIIDLVSGDQPMFSDDGSIAVIFNGEIYNYIELRDELKKLGHSFKTTSDTEVIIHAYLQWGTDCQNKFNGMWAFALWDEKKQHLFLSRDRIGEKPLFYSVFNKTLVFGSEIKSLLSFGCPAEPDLSLTSLYLTLSYIPAPYSFYKNIKKLQPGHFIIATTDKVAEHKYWDLPVIDESDMITDKKLVNKTFEELLSNSVEIRMRSDVPFGAFLSGGLDSTSIVALMSDISKSPVRTFTIGYKDKMFDERDLALLVAKKFKTDHSEYVIEPDAFEDSLNMVLAHFDEPFGDSSAIPTGKVSEIAVRKVKMVLTGDGGDEVLSGYTPYQGEKFAEKYQRVPSLIRNILPGAIGGVGKVFTGNLRYKLNRAARVLATSNMPFKDRLMTKMWSSPETASKLVGDHGPQIQIADVLDDLFNKYKARDPFYKTMFYHIKGVLPDDYLVKVDRMSMAHSLETRVPFLDHRLVEFMTRVHKDVKMEGYERKSVLRNTIGKRLPQELLNATKKGFGVPLRTWFRDAQFDQKLQSLTSDDIGLNTSMIRKMVDDNLSGRQDLGNFLWMLFVYREWVLHPGLRKKSNKVKNVA